MKQQNSATKSGKPAKSRRKTREELDREARERKHQKKHRGNAAGSRASGSEQQKGTKGANPILDPRTGSKKPIPLGVTEKPRAKPLKPTTEKLMLTPQAELEMLENDERLDALLERVEKGETLSEQEQSWVNAKLDRIDALMEQLGISFDEDEDEEKDDDLMRLLKGGN